MIVLKQCYAWGSVFIFLMIIVAALTHDTYFPSVLIPCILFFGYMNYLIDDLYYFELRKKVFFDGEGNYLLKGKETRMPM